MQLPFANLGRVLAGTIALFAVWLLGGFIGGGFFPESSLVNKMETLPTKIGSTVGVLLTSVFLQRFLLRSLRVALACVTTTEVVVFLIILQVTGLTSFRPSDLAFNIGWLFTLTWNVVAACFVGCLIGAFWGRQPIKPSPTV